MLGLELVPECYGYDGHHSATVQPFGEATEWIEHDVSFGFTPTSPARGWWDDCGVED